MDWLKENLPGVHSFLRDSADRVSVAANSVVPSISNDDSVRSSLALPSEPAGYTASGGRRHRTRGRKSGKTRRRKAKSL
jgi:hypothetical protein